ncbi:LacI family DNA-binding transcriptional regulator [Puniceicoccus vermicola]|uniref:LacI family DNA-binding transcriptional regulator n=1 Tax=Puniceicoccus vermicola TaxID=388746 RepID=A0A7X1B2Y0_9BACT|nr:LacI family DNA-binding transcriptional regulator [Puniceicoccus vermicola]MBC2603435.1 LacI family DNA-binding transcriptional regulator [Puniceicoccus vermicola]
MKTSPRKPRAITISQISKAADVSPSAVSALLNDRDYGIRISEKTRARIMKACRELNYRPKNPAALARIYPSMGDICFLINSGVPGGVHHHYFGQMLSGAVASLEDPTSHIAYSLFDPEIDYVNHPESLPQSLRSGSATQIIAASTPNTSFVQAILKRNIPFVYLGHHMDEVGLCSIVPDYAEATRQSVRYLAQLGHRRIAYLTGPFGDSTYNLLELQRGYVEGLRDCGFPISPQYIYHCDFDQGNFGQDQLIEATKHLISLKERPSAIMCFHDTAATVVASYLQSVGLRIPEDISIMGCNDEPSASTYHPPLSTVHFPLSEMGARAVKELENQILFGRLDKPVNISLPVSIVERQSCGPCPSPSGV